MAQFLIKIAGKRFAVASLFESTRDYCRNYIADEEPDFFVTVTREDLSFEQEALRQEALDEGLRVRVFTDPFLERTVIQRKTAEFLFDQDVLMTHGSTVAVDGKAYLFTAKCGTGKSTHTRLWRQAFGDRAVMVNDDKPFLQISQSGIFACGSPWSGKHGLDSNLAAPLQGICILQRGTENRIHRISPDEALPMLLHQSYCPLNPEKRGRFEELVHLMAETTPLWHMQCNKDPSAAETAYTAMYDANF